MMQVLLVIQVLIACALIGVVLLQRSDSDGFGLGSGGGGNFMSGRAQASLMTRVTAILATAFIINSLALSILAARGSDRSIVSTVQEQEASAPAVPAVPDTTEEPTLKKETAPKAAPAKTVESTEDTGKNQQ